MCEIWTYSEHSSTRMEVHALQMQNHPMEKHTGATPQYARLL